MVKSFFKFFFRFMLFCSVMIALILISPVTQIVIYPVSANSYKPLPPDSVSVSNLPKPNPSSESTPPPSEEQVWDGGELSTDFQDNMYDLMLDSVAGPLTYYNQGDIRWRDYLYGGRDRLGQYGCGPTVMAMLISSLTNTYVTPDQMCDWAVENRCWCPGQGSYHCLIPDSAKAYQLKVESMKNYTPEGIYEALNSGKLLVALMKKGHFTNQGHFIIITQISENGKVRIADSNLFENTQVDWEIDLILKELNHGASSGGPIWAVSVP